MTGNKRILVLASIAAAAIVAVALGWWLGRRSGSPPLAPDVKGFHKEALASCPSASGLVLTMDVGFMIDQLIDNNLGLFPVRSDPRALRGELSDASKAHFGVDLLAARRAVLWAAPESNAVAVLFEGAFEGALKGDAASTAGTASVVKLSRELHAAVTKSGLLVGNPHGVRLGAETLAGNSPSIVKDDDAKKAHQEALDAVADGSITVSVRADSFRALLPYLPDGIRGASVAFGSDGSLTAAAIGDAATLAPALGAYQAALAQGKVLVDELLVKANKEATEEPESEMAWAILGLTLVKHKFDDLAALVQLELEGEALKLRVDGGPAGSAAAIIGASAAVAIPAFTKYMGRAKTTEAVAHLDHLCKASALYYATPRVAAGTGERVPCQFPPSAPATPATSCCDREADADGDGRCDANPSVWSGETWSALGFQLNDAHYFRYAYTSNGLTGSAAMFTVSAYADLDCDGEFSTFERQGYGEDPGPGGECSMKGSAGLYKEDETE